ncbi:hypothetical protein E4U59_000136 [Claviceps monticola]|nr:hypothetical protein E4U59_000136 [Claviceps monticola]
MDGPSGTSMSETPGALPLDPALAGAIEDDEEEWEYEYSTTETETFYLTLELSYPDFKERSARAYHHSRGGYYKNWQDHESSAPNIHTKQTSKTTGGDDTNINTNSDDDDDGDGEGEGEEGHDNSINPTQQDDDEDGTLLDPALRALSKGKEPAHSANATTIPGAINKETSEKGSDIELDVQKARAVGGKERSTPTQDVQILELHSEHPLISYRGRLFEGDWAEVVGTEAIFALRDPSKPLPALRNLPGDIDLLAASSSRILTKEKIAKPKDPEQDTLAPIKKEWNIRIPVGKDKSGERAEQTSFLENLIALKMKRGDKDQVTVFARDGAGKDWDDKKALDFKPRKKKLILGDEAPDCSPDKGKATEKRRNVRLSVGGDADDSEDGLTEARGMSTPTPRRWEDLTY